MLPILQHEISARILLNPDHSSCRHAKLAVLGDVPSAWVSPLTAWLSHQNSETEGVRDHSSLSTMWAKRQMLTQGPWGESPTTGTMERLRTQTLKLGTWIQIAALWGFPGGTVVENLPANAGDTGSSPGLGRSHMPRSD